jgi:hypothetical protein
MIYDTASFFMCGDAPKFRRASDLYVLKPY